MEEPTPLNEDFLLSLVNRYESQLSSSGDIEKYSLEGNLIAENTSTTKSLKELTVFLAVPDKNITTEVRFEGLTPGSSSEKELMSVKLNPKDNPPPVLVTETISSSEDPKEDYRIVYPLRENKIFVTLTVKNQGVVIVPKIRLTKSVEFLNNFQQNQTKVDSGKFMLEKSALIWDIEDLNPGQLASLTFAANLVVGSTEPPLNAWTSLVYEMPIKTQNKSLWNIKKIQIPNPINVEQRVFKKIQSEMTINQWDCQVALKNTSDWDLILTKITVVQGTSKTPVFERSQEKGNPAINLSAHQAWQSDIWVVKQEIKPSFKITIENEFLPKTSEQILYDLAISESPFEMAKIDASRSILSVESTSPNKIRLLIRSVLKNVGTASLNDVEIIHQFPTVVELPSASEVSLTLQGTQLPKSNIEVIQSSSEELPDCNLFRILIRNFIKLFGGLKASEELHATFPVTLKKDADDGTLKFPTFFNALVRPNAPLLEAVAADYSIANLEMKRKADETAIKPTGVAGSFEAEVITKFSKLAVDAYNEHKYEDALAYCEQISSVAQKLEDKALVQNYTKIIAKLRGTISQKTQKKG